MMPGNNNWVLKSVALLAVLVLLNVKYIISTIPRTMPRCNEQDEDTTSHDTARRKSTLALVAADVNNNVPGFPGTSTSPSTSTSDGGDHHGGSTRSTCAALFPEFIPTTNSIWSRNLTRIAEATTDHDLSFAFMAEMLLIASPLRLQLGVEKLPGRDYEPVKRAIDIAYARYKYVQALDLADTASTTKDEEHDPPKLQILVMGGSVTAGVRCRELIDNPVNLDPKNRLFLRDFEAHLDCAWPNRLQNFINNIIGDVVEVTNAALRASDSSIGQTMLEGNYMNTGMPSHPDIIINAFSTNDVGTVNGTSNLEEFVRYVLRDEQCQKPLLIHFMDKVGTQNSLISNVKLFAEKVHTMAKYYGFGSVSYTSVLDEVISADSQEYWFKPVGWNNRARNHEEGHPQLGMHVVSAWTVGYYLLNLVTTYCSLEPVILSNTGIHKPSELQGNQSQGIPPGKPKHAPSAHKLPPALTSDLTVGQLSEKWSRISNDTQEVECTTAEDSSSKRCTFSWISGISKDSPEDTFAPFIVNNTGWSFVTDHAKLGLVAEGANSKMTLEFRNATHPIRSVMIMAMKSYGDRWNNSHVLVQAFEFQQNNETMGYSPLPLASMDIQGFHNSETSVSYKYSIPINIKDATPGSTSNGIGLTMELVGGSTAKIMGLSVCS